MSTGVTKTLEKEKTAKIACDHKPGRKSCGNHHSGSESVLLLTPTKHLLMIFQALQTNTTSM
eukprot:m.73645 g.73645  ORF g.73645 m.73645 type:complete len:62 (+) comp12429_c0_seq1:773-958(+)